MPTLGQFLTMSDNFPDVELHIELKTPNEEKVWKKYDYKLAVKMTIDEIKAHGAEARSQILSFDE